MPATQDEITRVAQVTFGYSTMRLGQVAAIQALSAGNDTLAVMPTGSGKSAIYQIAATLSSAPTLVISPLIALQRDQVESIQARDIGGAAQVSSTVSAAEHRQALADFAEGKLRFLFLAPEQFNNEETLAAIHFAQPKLFVVDEAHCVSAWGHDFRPEYLRLGAVIESLEHPLVLALTATAAPPVRAEILERLGMSSPQEIVSGFDRPNIWLGVERYEEEEAKQRALLDRVAKTEKPGIIYVATHKQAEELAETLKKRDIHAVAYHAGMSAHERDAIQQAFMDDTVEVMVATIAFGMGIDKPNVRFVYHYHIGDSIDSYYQEIGRAGRDGAPARARLFYRPEDLGIFRFFAGSGKTDEDLVEAVLERLRRHREPVEPATLKSELDISEAKLSAAIDGLAEAGALEVLPTGELKALKKRRDVEQVSEEAEVAEERRKEYERSRLQMMDGYANTRGCRRTYLLNYFGEHYEPPCNYCDNCQARLSVATAAHEPFPVDSRVRHSAWGEGTVLSYEADKIVVLFDSVGYKTLGLDYVLQQKLLAAVD